MAQQGVRRPRPQRIRAGSVSADGLKNDLCFDGFTHGDGVWRIQQLRAIPAKRRLLTSIPLREVLAKSFRRAFLLEFCEEWCAISSGAI